MPNHFHLLVRQDGAIPTSKLISKVCTSYSKYLNKKYDRVGHVFQDQFKQVLVEDNDYLVWLSAYIHVNPKTAGLVEKLADYKWSSYPNFIKPRFDYLCDPRIILDQFKNIEEFEKFVEDSCKIIKKKKELEHLLLD